MSFQTKAYLFIIICTGFASLAAYLPAIGTADPFRFAAYLVLAMLASCMKVSLPGITGTVSVLFVFLLIGITDLSLPETLIMGAVAACVQSFWHAKKPRKLVHFSFNVASIAIAIQAAYLAYTAPVFLRISVPAPLPLLAAALVFFAANTLTVAVVIALTEGKPVLRTWTSNYFWSFPYYIIGACVAGLFSYFTRLVGWQTSILALPVVYLIYRSYRLYLDRLDESRSHGEQLRIAANRLNAVLESTSDCVFAVSDEGRITYTNKRARSRLFGDSDVVGTILWEKFPKLESSGFRDQFKRTLADKIPLDDEVFFPELNAWFEVRAYSSTEGIALYLKEVTEQRELSEQLRQAQRMEVVGRLAGGVAHDFNNLLTIILGYGEIVVSRLGDDHPARSGMMEVLSAAKRAAALTRQLLAFSRKQILQPEVLDLNAVVSGMEGMLTRLIGEDVHISVSLDPDIGRILGDHSQIEQVVMNLAVNARDAMPHGGELKIETYSDVVEAPGANPHGSVAGKYAVLSVSDTGHGMDAETRAKIFEPFFTTKDTGTGLGLSTVYGIVQQIKGSITVRSELGRGSVFCVQFPCVADAETPAETFEVHGRFSGSGKILLVEDEEAVRRLALRMLSEAGYTVVSTNDAGDALRLPKAELDSINLVVTDVVMFGMSGPDLAGHLLKRHPELKVLYLSGYTDHPLISAGALSHRERLLQKPFTRNQLLIKVQELLHGELRAGG